MSRYIDLDKLLKWANSVELTQDGGIDINDFDEYISKQAQIVEFTELVDVLFPEIAREVRA